jgi:drug/metabolite transporter (DMT)-like permease
VTASAHRAKSATAGSRRRDVAVPFAIATLIWGSTWLAIKFQLGTVAPEVSVVYRFALASLLLFAWCRATRRPLALTGKAHALAVAQGALTFGFNYVAVYWAEQYVASGLVAVVFSTVVFMTPVAMRIGYGTPISSSSFVAAAMGVAGVSLLFLPELAVVGEGGAVAKGIGWALVATTLAACGSVVVVRQNRAGVGLLPGTAWGMLYGSLWAAVVAAIAGAAWTFDTGAAYVLSLGYLAVFGSVMAFLAYFTLLRRVGPGPASFTGVSTPVLAMVLSTLFEGYRWNGWAILGVALAVGGNILALRGARPRK